MPLINVVFLLLLFFLLAGRLRGPEHLDVQIPSSRSEADVTAPLTGVPAYDREPAVVHLAADGRLALDGEPLALPRLAAELRARSSGSTNGSRIELRADARVRARHFLPLLTGLRDAGAGDIELVTLELP